MSEQQTTSSPVADPPADKVGQEQHWLVHFLQTQLLDELTGNPINIVLLLAIIFLIYKIFKKDSDSSSNSVPVDPPLPPMKKRDFTLEQLKDFDGKQPDGRVLMGVLGKVYDVTKGKKFYGPGGPYSAFAGHDASRGLATFDVTKASDTYDDLSDLKPSELEQVREWDEQFRERYTLVGKLLKPGEEPSVYTDDEDEPEDTKKDQ